MEKCIFCKIVKGEIKQDFEEESENFVAFLDVNPQTPGHTLIVPKKHFTNILDLPSDLGKELLEIIKKVANKRLKEGADGFNVTMNNFPAAQQLVMHSHVHILPRKKGDNIKLGIIKFNGSEEN